MIKKIQRFIRRVKELEGLYSKVARLEYKVDRFHSNSESSLSFHPQLNDKYCVSFENGLGKWTSHFQYFQKDKYIRFLLPTCEFIDSNHRNKLGVIQFLLWLWTCPKEIQENTSFLGNGDPDLRGAKVSVEIRGRDFKPNGAELFWWSQAQRNIEIGDNKDWRRSCWIYKDFPLTRYLLDGEWHNVKFTLVNDETKWLEAGSSSCITDAENYEFWELDNVLGHQNWNGGFILAFVEARNLPAGLIDVRNFELEYHNRQKAVKEVKG